jgi:N-acyl-D-amino-acid deacylase
MLDMLIRGGTVLDGTGRLRYVADVGVTGSRIEAVGDLSQAEAREVLDAGGLCVSPGFIDMHTHSELSLMEDGRGQSKVRQGVTTELVGHCGLSPYPFKGHYRSISPARSAYSGEIEEIDWTDLAGYAARINRQGTSVHVAPLVGHGSIRTAVMGYEDRKPTAEELEQMRRLLSTALEQGAFGLSAGLTVVPGSYADTDEMVALAEVVASHGRIVDIHGRFWAGWHFKAAEEAVEISRRAGAAVQVAHLAIIDARYWTQAERLAGILGAAAESSVDVTFDVYPYVAAGTGLSQMLPGWVQEGGLEQTLSRMRDPQTRRRLLEDVNKGWFHGIPWAWETFVIVSPGPAGDRTWMGRSIQQIAEEWDVHPSEAYLRLIELSGDSIQVVVFNRTEEDMQHFLKHPLSMVGSDGNAIAVDGPRAKVLVHPRYYGAHARVLGRYVRELGVLSLEQAVLKMSTRPAARLGLRDRGKIAAGYVADLTLFDPQTVSDRATFERPHQYAVGVPHVMVNGTWVVRDGEHTGALPTGVLPAP